jgi:hypothetical protein
LDGQARRQYSESGASPQADNVNVLDEVPNSSWYHNRHFLKRMSIAQLEEGPGWAHPDDSGPLEIVAGKFEGGTAGFTIKDAAGQYFLLKFDSEDNNEMGSSAEVIATKFLHAAGYNVPRNSVVYLDPSRLVIGSKAKVPKRGGGKRKMEKRDMQAILDNIIPQEDGRLRCVASRFLSGKPVGIFDYHGRRKDDSNDRVDHEHRRELRGLRVIGSWMNDADRRAANTLDMFVSEEDGRRYIRHYLIDMGSAFGSNNLMPHPPKYGNEYVWDPRTIAPSSIPRSAISRTRLSAPLVGCRPIRIPRSSAAPIVMLIGGPRSSCPSPTQRFELSSARGCYPIGTPHKNWPDSSSSAGT